MNIKFSVLFTGLALSCSLFAATPVDLHQKPISYLQKLTAARALSFTSAQAQLKPNYTRIDFNGTAHTRMQQTYAGYPVWDSAAVVHTPHANKNMRGLSSVSPASTMNGVIYDGLEKDLANTPAYALSDVQKTKALQQAKFAYEKKTGVKGVFYQEESIHTIIFLDKTNQAHYAYLISFLHDDGKTGAHRPMIILDAASLEIYRSWVAVMNAQ